MKKVLLLLLVGLLVSPAVNAAGLGKVFVSSLGRDTGNCGSLLAPCRNLTAAVTQVKPGGEIVLLDGGPFPGTTVTKSVTISEAVGVGTVTLGFPGLYVLAGPADVVTLRDLVVRPDPVTIIAAQLGSGRALHVDHCVFADMNLALAVTGGQLVVTNTMIKNVVTGIDAISVNPGKSVFVTLDGCTIETANGGVYVRDDANLSATRSTFTDCDGAVTTIPATGASANAQLDHCLIANNRTAIMATTNGGTSVTRISNTTITGNNTGVQVYQATVYSLGNNMIYGNMWDVQGDLTLVSPR